MLCSGDYRQALRYIIRNTALPARTRAIAQLQLSQMHCYTRSTQIKNRCTMGGKGRGVLRDFKMSRVCPTSLPGMDLELWLTVASIVYVSNECSRRQYPRREEGQLVRGVLKPGLHGRTVWGAVMRCLRPMVHRNRVKREVLDRTIAYRLPCCANVQFCYNITSWHPSLAFPQRRNLYNPRARALADAIYVCI